MTETTEGMRILSLEAENVKRLRAVHITPDGSMVLISGENGAGKSSVIDCIEMALGGKPAIPDEPIRRGKRRATIRLGLGEYHVERTITKGSTALKVTAADGTAVSSPQTMLNDLLSALSFDPLDFVLMDPNEQGAVLRNLVGLDFTELDSDRAALYASRTEKNREVKERRRKFEACVQHADAPSEEISISDLLAELERREATITAGAVLVQKRQDVASKLEAATELVADAQVQIDRIKAELCSWEEALAFRQDQRDELEAAVATAQGHVDAHEIIDPDEIRKQLDTAEATNRKVRQNAKARELAEEVAAAERESREITGCIDDIDEKKADMLANAEYPVDGLGFSDDGSVLLDGLPFDQACTSAKIRVSVAIGSKLNPRLRVLLVRRGNDLDKTRLAELAKMAEEQDLQLWVERIEDGGQPAIVIEDGQVAGA